MGNLGRGKNLGDSATGGVPRGVRLSTKHDLIRFLICGVQNDSKTVKIESGTIRFETVGLRVDS